MATLYQISNNGFRAGRWEIEEGPVVVGRSGQAKVSIEDAGVSRRHFLISREGDDYLIKDLNSRNGTWVAGRRIIAARLHDHDLILAGHTLFRFARLPSSSTPADKPRTGPHGTVVISIAPRSECRLSEAMLWQQDSAGWKPPALDPAEKD